MASGDNDESFPWEDEVRELLSDVIAGATIDEDARVVQIGIDGVHRGFTDLDSLRDVLVDHAEDEIMSRAPGHGADYSDVNAIVDDVLAGSSLEAYFDELSPKPDKNQLLLNFEGLLTEAAESRVRIDLGLINAELIRHLASHPEQMRSLRPRAFEELVAELFRSAGYDVLLTPKTRDGGLDFRAYRKEPFGTVLTLVECKRYREKKVGVGIVRGLYGVLGRENAPYGVVVTTSFFTRDAIAEHRQIRTRMSLADYDALSAWLKSQAALPGSSAL